MQIMKNVRTYVLEKITLFCASMFVDAMDPRPLITLTTSVLAVPVRSVAEEIRALYGDKSVTVAYDGKKIAVEPAKWAGWESANGPVDGTLIDGRHCRLGLSMYAYIRQLSILDYAQLVTKWTQYKEFASETEAYEFAVRANFMGNLGTESSLPDVFEAILASKMRPKSESDLARFIPHAVKGSRGKHQCLYKWLQFATRYELLDREVPISDITKVTDRTTLAALEKSLPLNEEAAVAKLDAVLSVPVVAKTKAVNMSRADLEEVAKWLPANCIGPFSLEAIVELFAAMLANDKTTAKSVLIKGQPSTDLSSNGRKPASK